MVEGGLCSVNRLPTLYQKALTIASFVGAPEMKSREPCHKLGHLCGCVTWLCTQTGVTFPGGFSSISRVLVIGYLVEFSIQLI